MRKLLLVSLLSLGLSVVPAFADQIFVQQSCTSTPCSAAGGDPNLITNPSSFVVGVAGRATGEDPLLIIVGVYNGDGVPKLTFGGSSEPLATIGTYNLKFDPLPNNNSGDEYADIGLNPQTNSETFSAWSSFDQTKLGLAKPSSFTLYTFALPGEEITGAISLSESGAAKGSFILAYDCKDDTMNCAKHGDIMDTPFTNVGVVDTTSHVTPEPASLLLFGSGLLGLGFKLCRSVKR